MQCCLVFCVCLESIGFENSLTINPFTSSARQILETARKTGPKQLPPGKTSFNLTADDRKELECQVCVVSYDPNILCFVRLVMKRTLVKLNKKFWIF